MSRYVEQVRTYHNVLHLCLSYLQLLLCHATSIPNLPADIRTGFVFRVSIDRCCHPTGDDERSTTALLTIIDHLEEAGSNFHIRQNASVMMSAELQSASTRAGWVRLQRTSLPSQVRESSFVFTAGSAPGGIMSVFKQLLPWQGDEPWRN